MGTIQHNAIIATTAYEKEIVAVREWVDRQQPETFLNPQRMFLFGPEMVNGETTVVLIPDGSKAGWAESNEGDKLRERFRNWLKGHAPRWRWVEVSYGEWGERIVNHEQEKAD